MTIPLTLRIQGYGLATYAQLVWRTARYYAVGVENLERAQAAGRSFIITSWHGMTMMMTGYLYTVLKVDPDQYRMVVPDDVRGEVLNVWADRMGAQTFTISMEEDSMVAARRLLELIRQIKEGKRLYLNPDGPDGPTHEPKSGVVFMARKSGALILPSAAYATPAYRVPRWDHYTVPLPFSRITVVLGEPMAVERTTDLEEARLQLKDRLNRAEKQVEALHRSPSNSAG